MARRSVNKKPPSRRRYEDEHPTRSCRLTKDEDGRLDELLEETGCSFADFVRDWLGREESMIKERVEMLAKKKAPLSVEGRLRFLEALMFQAFVYLRDHDWPPYCPRCTDQELLFARGDEIGSTGAHQETRTLRCPKCGYFLNTPKGIDWESIKWSDPDAAKVVSKPKASA